MQVTGFSHVTINVKDLTKSLEFYGDKLGMKVRHQGKKDVYLEWGDAWVCLIEKENYQTLKKDQLGTDHIAFYIEEKFFNDAVEILKRNQIEIVRGPIQRGMGRSINFLDPDGIELELHTSSLNQRMTIWK